jgi:hypothetical protein
VVRRAANVMVGVLIELGHALLMRQPQKRSFAQKEQATAVANGAVVAES